MAVTGIILVAYLITHVAANLLVFEGPTRINAYAAMLHGTGAALWGARLVLLVAVVLHIVAAVQLTRRRQAARPVGYAAGREPPGLDPGVSHDPLGRGTDPGLPGLPHPPLHDRHAPPRLRAR